jgi:glyoxylase-like metal-dependent hydrolase (beta-lactamase superfamily II)
VVVVDVGFRPSLVLDRVMTLGARVKYILATHSHRDHIGAAGALRGATGALLAAYKTVPGVDVMLEDGDELRVGTVPIGVLHTPGHSPDSVCFLVDGTKLITGDTLYVGGVPKPPASSLRRPFYASLHNRLLLLGDGVEVWPGHNNGRTPSSTIGAERRGNPVLKMGYEDFCNRRWDRQGKRWVVS